MGLHEDVVTAIKAELDSITNIGVTHNRKRYAENETQLKQYFGTTVGGKFQIRGWEITRSRIDSPMGSFAERLDDEMVYAIIGWLGWDDLASTEIALQELADSVRQELNATNWDATPLSVSGVYRTGPCRMTTFREMMFAGVLCHNVEIEFPVLYEGDLSGV